MMLTGEKTDIWLVKMVGLLSVAIGLVLLNGRKSADKKVLAIAAALAFIVIDVYYTFQGIISQIYLLDAAVQVFFAGWVVFIKSNGHNRL
ncbi:MAG TPA: hypothetical protein VN040_14845 [Pseudosphingobacterium sp.]|nr:hypothetical protein [Pseudosphingobacterium sp.]